MPSQNIRKLYLNYTISAGRIHAFPLRIVRNSPASYAKISSGYCFVLHRGEDDLHPSIPKALNHAGICPGIGDQCVHLLCVGNIGKSLFSDFRVICDHDGGAGTFHHQTADSSLIAVLSGDSAIRTNTVHQKEYTTQFDTMQRQTRERCIR